MLKESVKLMMDTVNGTIHLSVLPGGTGAAVNWVEFDSYKAEQKRALSVLG